MDNLHYIQLNILKKLLFAETLKFSELKPFDIENNQLTFHLDRLIKDGLVEKVDDGYKLTVKGKEFANRMDTDKAKMQLQGKIGVIQCCINNQKSENEFLLYTRLKHPFYGSQGYSSGKVRFGETIKDAAKRELKEETNLEGEPELFMIEHHLVYSKDEHKLLEDKYFYFCKIINPKGELKANEEGKFEWVKESEVSKYLKKPFESVERILYITERIKDLKKEITFEEITHFTDSF